MAVSGRKAKMAKGRLDNAVVKFTNCEWVEETTKNGKDVVQLSVVFVDEDGQDHPYNLILGDQQYVRVDDGKLQSVDERREYQISERSPVGKILSSLEDAGFSGKKLDAIGDNPSVLDGQWVRVVQKAGTSMKQDGTPFTDLIVEELVDEPSGKKSAKASATSSKAASGKGKASAVKKDDDDETDAAADADDDDDADDEDDDDGNDEVADAARETVLSIIGDPEAHVRNYDADANDGGVSLKQAYTASFTAFSGNKKLKGPVSNLINDAKFHAANAKSGLYKFDAKTGVLSANPTKKGRK